MTSMTATATWGNCSGPGSKARSHAGPAGIVGNGGGEWKGDTAVLAMGGGEAAVGLVTKSGAMLDLSTL